MRNFLISKKMQKSYQKSVKNRLVQSHRKIDDYR